METNHNLKIVIEGEDLLSEPIREITGSVDLLHQGLETLNRGVGETEERLKSTRSEWSATCAGVDENLDRMTQSFGGFETDVLERWTVLWESMAQAAERGMESILDNLAKLWGLDSQGSSASFPSAKKRPSTDHAESESNPERTAPPEYSGPGEDYARYGLFGLSAGSDYRRTYSSRSEPRTEPVIHFHFPNAITADQAALTRVARLIGPKLRELRQRQLI